MHFWHILLMMVLISIHSIEVKAESTRPRGVSPQLAPLYQERAAFECLDGNKKIPFDQVNDDYCDCEDGSDEPGTSACKNGRFYCPNFGFRPETIPSSRVNDFICDCCDGSDEWDSGTDCPNLCESLGAKAREEAKQQAEVQEAGYAKRKELAEEGAKILEEKKSELEKKRKELEQLEEVKSGTEERKKIAEEAETEAKKTQDELWEEKRKTKRMADAEELFRKVDADGDAWVTSDEMKLFAGYEESGSNDRETELLVELFKEDSGGRINTNTFVEHYDQVKELIEKVRESKREEKRKADEEAAKQTSDEGEEEEVEEDLLDTSGDKVEESEERPPYDEQTQQMISKADEARKEYEEVASKVADLEGGIRDSEAFLNFEYGPDDAWAPMKGQCAELTTTQYVYKLCLFDRTVQKDRNGHSEINLGYWGKWDEMENNENKYTAQRYEHGLTCWNGPERSTFVQFECGEELQLIDASEPSKCEYHFLAKSPAACANPEDLRKAAEHAEL